MDENNAPLQSEEENVNIEEPKVDPSDNLTPEHPRFKEVVAEKNELKATVTQLQTQMDELREQVQERKQQTGEDELTADETASLARIARGLKAQGFLTQEEQNIERRATSLKGSIDKHNGKDGLPKFDQVDVLTYAKRNGFGDNYEAAYKDMHFEAIVQQASKSGGNLKVPDSERPDGGEKESMEEKTIEEAVQTMSDDDFNKFMTNFKAKALKP